MKKVLAIALALVLVLSLAACAGSSSGTASTPAASAPGAAASTPAASTTTASGDTFKLGAYLGITGPNSAYGIEVRNAVELGIEEINAAGGLNGKQIEFIVYDTQCSTEEAAKVAIKLCEEDKVDAVIGSMNSGEVFAAGKYFAEAGIYHLGLGTAASWMKEDWPCTFRPAMNNDNAVPIATKLVPALGYKTIAIFNGQEDAALNTADSFQNAFEAMGLTVVDRESYDAGDTDYSGQIHKMLSANPDIILISVIGETGGPIVRQLRQGGYNGIILDKESFMASQIEIAGAENSNYICFANPYVTYNAVDDCTIEIVKTFLQKYYDKYGVMVATDSAYRGYDAINVLKAAADAAGSNDTEALVAATNALVMPGLGGTIDFTSGSREAYESFNSFILVDGQNVLFSDWQNNGGYDAYLAATGRDR